MEQFNARGLTRDDLREVMRFLAAQRQASTPEHTDPAWMAAQYRHIVQ